MDVRGNKQERDLSYAQISSLNSVHGRTLFNPAKDGGGSMQ